MCLSVHIDSVSIFPVRIQSTQSNLKWLMTVSPSTLRISLQESILPFDVTGLHIWVSLSSMVNMPRLLVEFFDSRDVTADKSVEPCWPLPLGVIMQSDKANRFTWDYWSSEAMSAYNMAVCDTVSPVLQSVPRVISFSSDRTALNPYPTNVAYMWCV
jgi:hypothetical protein